MSVWLSDSAKSQSPFSYLYTRVVSSHLGETSAIIVSALISYGRLSAKELHLRSKVPLKQLKTTLVCLIQLNCIYYWADNDKNVYYSFNENGVLTLLHAGDIVSRIKHISGDEAAELTQNIIENGNLNVREYMATLENDQSQHDKMAILVKLYNDGWLRKLRPIDFLPVEDVWNKLYQETLKNTPRTATTSEVKRVAEAKEKTKVKFSDAYLAGTDTKDIFVVDNGIHKLRPDITITFNLDRYEKYLRTRALVELANSRLGLITSTIYGRCAGLIETKSPPLKHSFLEVSGLINDPEELRAYISSVENALVDNKAIVFNIRDLARSLPNNLDLRNSILTQNFLKPAKRPHDDMDQPAKKIKLEDGEAVAPDSNGVVNGSSNGGLNEDDDYKESDRTEAHSVTLLAEHMRLLSSGNVPFLVEVAPGSYTIPFLQLSKCIKQFHYGMLIKTTMGSNSLRVLNCIKSMKLADEKAISNAVLLKDRTVKSEIYKLVNMNVLEIQEVPRSADRAASKTFYLFRHKELPLYKYLSFALAYTMADILTNISQFKLEHKILLDKCEREDVKGNEEELLLESELKTLRGLQQREIANLGRFNRIKWLQVVFGLL
ncbi:CIC11C00000002773 [Sungouiella intermedia]|uniref:DNA-directed RNA polymerase III subunit RPC3 n=1 Tax=Sungouiella intermedia TaxID=45354 RepID=A0A1L0C4C2_9ASCO|nr:CIC11C00000002773 [[Candida] intermedia]